MVNDDLSMLCADTALTSIKNLSIESIHSEIKRCVPHELLDAPITSYRISNLRYSPRKKMVVGLTSSISKRPISLRIFPRDAMQNRLTKARLGHPDHTFLFEGLNAIAWVFPGERKLNLDLVANPSRLAELLRQHRGYEMFDMELMHFVPEHTYTARVIGKRDDQTMVREYIKIYYNDQGATTSRIMKSLAKAMPDSRIRIPDDVSYIPEHRLLIQSEIQQVPNQALSNSAAASALAAFHQLSTEDAPARLDSAQFEHDSVLAIVDKVLPGLMSETRDVSEAVLAAIKETPHSRPVLLHGDAHLGNLFPIADGLTGVIDLDRVAWGRAEHDLASFLAFKVWLHLRDRLDPDLVLCELPRFVATYNTSAKHALSVRSVFLTLAHKMISERLRRGITRGKVSDAREILSFISIARRCLEAAGHCHD